MPTTDSPLRYPGGKTQLAPFVGELLRANDLFGAVYAEPYAGGCGLALRLLLGGQVSEIWLNDIDPGVYAFWWSVLEEADALCEMVDRVRITMPEWRRQREVIARGRVKRVERGFATLFLNRTNRSGIIQGGVIGGKNQTGAYAMDCRFNRAELIAKIQRVACYRDVIRLTRIDAAECIPLWGRLLPKRGLMNIDPPYYVQGRELYTNFYTHREHAAIAKIVRRLKCNWMVTYDDVPEIQRLYAGLPLYRKGLTYSAQVKRRASELLVLSKSLAAPGESLVAA